jgi:DNA-binding NtrC family response regulator
LQGLAAPMVGLLLSDKKKTSKVNDYKNNRTSPISQKEESNDGGNDRPLAKVLVIDDDPDIVRVLKLGLQKNRFLVSGFTNPEEALQSIKSNTEDYCLVLSDIRMPVLSGIQLARKVKEINPSIKVLLMTAFFEIRDDEFSKVFPSVHVDGFVQKPIGIKDLTNKILSIIGKTKKTINDEDR